MMMITYENIDDNNNGNNNNSNDKNKKMNAVPWVAITFM